MANNSKITASKTGWVAFTTADPRGKASAVDYSIKQIQ